MVLWFLLLVLLAWVSRVRARWFRRCRCRWWWVRCLPALLCWWAAPPAWMSLSGLRFRRLVSSPRPLRLWRGCLLGLGSRGGLRRWCGLSRLGVGVWRCSRLALVRRGSVRFGVGPALGGPVPGARRRWPWGWASRCCSGCLLGCCLPRGGLLRSAAGSGRCGLRPSWRCSSGFGGGSCPRLSSENPWRSPNSPCRLGLLRA